MSIGKIHETGRYDGYSGYRPPDGSSPPWSTPEQQALCIPRDLLQQHVDNLAAGGHDQSKAKVATKDWAAMLRRNGIPLETMETLLLTGWVATDGTYVFIKV